MRASVRPCLENGIGNVMRANVRPCFGHGISIDSFEIRASVRPCLGYGIDLNIATKLVSGINGRRRHRSHYHLKLWLVQVRVAKRLGK
ncbi:Anthranilate phosphoribosyltransferase [Gossypium arboreum]|uniref:Anthranilate phosphoribosyltransferase n=1 Tax=Gossypium arboreum TaxID=29729 RepID=A0A0B0MTJ3_GOSAR|nr:Anthranilate phosphoribosyltransferase [Gossypium arboreum]